MAATKTQCVIMNLADCIAALDAKPCPAAQALTPPPALALPTHFIDPRNAKQFKLLIAMRKHFCLVGPRGCGKSSGIRHYLSSHGIPFIKVQCEKSMDTETLVGATVARVNNGKQEFDFQWGKLVDAMENGTVVLMEEFDTLHPDRVTALFSILDDTPEYTLQVDGNTRHIVKHPDFMVITTSNTRFKGEDGAYAGTEVANTALADRFWYMLPIDYLPKEQETNLLVDRFGVTLAVAKNMVEIARMTREQAAADSSIDALSTRRLLAWAYAYTNDIKQKTEQGAVGTAKMAFLDSLDNPDQAEALVKAINNKFV